MSSEEKTNRRLVAEIIASGAKKDVLHPSLSELMERTGITRETSPTEIETMLATADFMEFMETRRVREAMSSSHATIGSLIRYLERFDSWLPVMTNNGKLIKASVSSYRGYYNDLAIHEGEPNATVAELIEVLKDAIGSVYEGYKGGNYTMHRDTLCWFATDYGDCSQMAFVLPSGGDIPEHRDAVILNVEHKTP